MYTNSFPDPRDPSGTLNWYIDDDGGNILKNDNTGEVLKRVPPLFLPDQTLMETGVLFRVEASRRFTINGIYNETALMTIEPGDFLIAKRIPNGEVCLFTNTATPFMILKGAKFKHDFKFITDLEKFKDRDIEMKLQRVLAIENYEYAAKIRDEIQRRKNLAERK